MKSGRGVKLTTHLHLVTRLRMVGLYLHSTVQVHNVMLNELSPRITLFYLDLSVVHRSDFINNWAIGDISETYDI
jgi:hypothetical protein